MTSKRLLAVPEVRGVHVIPSDDVRTAPENPVATKVFFPKVMPDMADEVPDDLDAHVVSASYVPITSPEIVPMAVAERNVPFAVPPNVPFVQVPLVISASQ